MKVRKKNVTKKRIYKKKSIKKMRKKNKKTLKHKYIKKGGNNQITITKEEINRKHQQHMQPISLIEDPRYKPFITKYLEDPKKVKEIEQEMNEQNLNSKILYRSEILYRSVDKPIDDSGENMIGKIFKCNKEYYKFESWNPIKNEGLYKKLNKVTKCKYAYFKNKCENHYKFVPTSFPSMMASLTRMAISPTEGKVTLCTTVDSHKAKKRENDSRSQTKCTSSTEEKHIKEIPEIINSNMVPHRDYYILKTKEEEEEEKKAAEKKEEEEKEAAERQRREEETRKIASYDSQKLSTNPQKPQTSNRKVVIYDHYPDWVPYEER